MAGVANNHTTSDVYDEFADPMNPRFLPPPSLTQRLKAQFVELPVFPIGITAFSALAGYGIWKYRRLPKRDAVSTTLYFTGLRIAAQSLAVGIIAVGALSHFLQEHWSKPKEADRRK